MITYKEYEKLVLEKLVKTYHLPKEKAIAFIKEPENQELLKIEYDSDISDLKNGKITEEILVHGGVSGTANCLYMLY